MKILAHTSVTHRIFLLKFPNLTVIFSDLVTVQLHMKVKYFSFKLNQFSIFLLSCIVWSQIFFLSPWTLVFAVYLSTINRNPKLSATTSKNDIFPNVPAVAKGNSAFSFTNCLKHTQLCIQNVEWRYSVIQSASSLAKHTQLCMQKREWRYSVIQSASSLASMNTKPCNQKEWVNNCWWGWQNRTALEKCHVYEKNEQLKTQAISTHSLCLV